MRRRFLSIAPEHLGERIRTGRHVTVLDVRTRSEYGDGHMQGALSLPLDELTRDDVIGLTGDSRIGTQHTLYLTCHSGGRALRAAEKLHDEGLDNLVLVKGGTEGWRQAGMPMGQPDDGVFAKVLGRLPRLVGARTAARAPV